MKCLSELCCLQQYCLRIQETFTLNIIFLSITFILVILFYNFCIIMNSAAYKRTFRTLLIVQALDYTTTVFFIEVAMSISTSKLYTVYTR